MTIEQIIKYLNAPICADTVIGKEKQKEYEAHDSAVIILRKYQRIVEICDTWYDKGLEAYDSIWDIIEVIEDDNSIVDNSDMRSDQSNTEHRSDSGTGKEQ